MATFDDVVRIGAELPEVVTSTWYGTPSLSVRTKSFCRLWSDREYARDHVDPEDPAQATRRGVNPAQRVSVIASAQSMNHVG